jgi:nucleoside-diphosphate-sugar epimerase
MDVLMTGPYGRVGNALRKRLDSREEYDFTYLDVRDHPETETVVADVTDYGAIRPAVGGQEAINHLALDTHMGSQHTDPEWLDALQRELEGTVNVFRAAVEAGVEKVVYATTHQLVEPYVTDHPSPEGADFVVDHTVPTRPDSLYGVVKAFGEQFARFCHEVHDLRCYGLRIGWVMAPDEDHPYAVAQRGVEEGEWERDSEAYEASVARQKWLSHRDAAHLVDCCLQDDTVEYDLFYGVSDNEGRFYDIDHARDVLGYDPQDDFAEWDGPPA